jgi:hypothetical protein
MFMTATALIFYPETFVGFNKTQLLERHLVSAGVIGSKLKTSSIFSTGHNFRQFIPQAHTIHKYQYGIIRIQIQAVGVWATAGGQVAINDRSNILLLEGDAIEFPLERYEPLCELLYKITGDRYRVDVAYEPMRNGISEASRNYTVNRQPDPVN